MKTVPATLFIRIGGYIDLKIARHGIRSTVFIYELFICVLQLCKSAHVKTAGLICKQKNMLYLAR